MLKFVLLSDIHLVEEDQTSHGLDTFWRLEKGIEAINERHSDADFCILAGDLVDKGFEDAVEPYNRLKSALDKLTIPHHVTIGNHDKRETFIEIFGDEVKSETGFIDKVIDLKGYRIIMLDSVIEGTHAGEIDEAQLTWLWQKLAEHDGPIIIILHHHTNPLFTTVDRLRLNNPDAFVDVLKTHNDIRQVIAGHVHYTSTALWHGIPFTTIAGSHYSVTAALGDQKTDRLWGPAQMGIILGDTDQTLIHFDNYLDGNPILG